MVMDFANKDLQESLLLPYYSPEIIKGEKTDEKSIIWTLGCILYELSFGKQAFWDIKNKNIKKKILNINYNLPEDCEKELSFILQKLICENNKRLTIKELTFEEIFKKIIFELNLFSEIVKDNVQDFNNYFSLNDGLFDEKDAINKFRLIELNEYPYYLVCRKCYTNPEIKLKDNETIIISCSKCNINVNEKTENIINYSSKYVSNVIKFCSSKHDEITPSNIYCKTHNLFLCQDCFDKHKNQEDIIKIFIKESLSIKNHKFIRLNKLKKNICIFHNKNLNLNCTQCNMEICDECKIDHNDHLIQKIDNKNIFLKKDYMEFENYIINNENKKREILKKVQENIIFFENYKTINKDEFNNVVKKILSKFYKDLEKGQNLLFLSKILFDSFIRMGKEDDKKSQYKNIINLINQFFNEEKIKEYDLSNFPVISEYKDKLKCVYESSFNFIPQIELKFNEVKEIDKEIIDSLKEKLKQIFKDKDVKIIEIKKGSLIACIALNYLIKEKLENTNMENKTFNENIKDLNQYLGLETKSIKDMLKNNLSIAQKDKQFKPDFANEKLYDLETTPGELVKCIKEIKNSKEETNLYQIFQNGKQILLLI